MNAMPIGTTSSVDGPPALEPGAAATGDLTAGPFGRLMREQAREETRSPAGPQSAEEGRGRQGDRAPAGDGDLNQDPAQDLTLNLPLKLTSPAAWSLPRGRAADEGEVPAQEVPTLALSPGYPSPTQGPLVAIDSAPAGVAVVPPGDSAMSQPLAEAPQGASALESPDGQAALVVDRPLRPSPGHPSVTAATGLGGVGPGPSANPATSARPGPGGDPPGQEPGQRGAAGPPQGGTTQLNPRSIPGPAPRATESGPQAPAPQALAPRGLEPRETARRSPGEAPRVAAPGPTASAGEGDGPGASRAPIPPGGTNPGPEVPHQARNQTIHLAAGVATEPGSGQVQRGPDQAQRGPATGLEPPLVSAEGVPGPGGGPRSVGAGPQVSPVAAPASPVAQPDAPNPGAVPEVRPEVETAHLPPGRPPGGAAELEGADTLGGGDPQTPAGQTRHATILGSPSRPDAPAPLQGSERPAALTPFHAQAEQRMAHRVDDPAWGEELGERVLWLLGRRENLAELRLNPPELGSLEIRVRQEKDSASVQILVQNGTVRETLESALPRLRELFGEAGLQLQRLDVGERQARQGGEGGPQRGPGSGYAAPEHLGGEEGRWVPSALGEGLVDTYA